ncbi:hypothetical protein G6F46_009267 [Rhizopus delemar]|uniref:Uncharacterized protein n=2 Tax=Rhizopus TaxID=4842 RepID=A0A9P7CK03_9FUNG|nr:hypothetical protein G6F55_008169 [Rhizopus delemar]KAG1536876.1 hypothetical protein G6F51_010711 [Rhizopus arrhizus]KAG1564971.1 hypothetical protein G6F50_010511 [Rhizopus delemar]KAG1611418.1 hypothetical protein G6F46_009267 [Rhizopus delemar]
MTVAPSMLSDPLLIDSGQPKPYRAVSIACQPHRHGSQGLTDYFSASHPLCDRGVIHATVDSADRSIELDKDWMSFIFVKGCRSRLQLT